MQVFSLPHQVEVVQLSGHLNAAHADAFRDQLIAAVSSGESTALLLDMSQVESMDSAGLMVLVSALSLAQSLNRPLNLCSVSAPVRIILELTQLDRLFPIFKDRAACETAQV
ncbi:hypothetical protein BST81_07760 [Leptolyngbya sp. 'hensonii']|uniref:STAS domain-containing protein n=1 Tax=Leptolyngbya sp. 'hensonii' TaxID=1922337 RepID=UPI00094FBFA8|nr:STAS domain-containing protein [Leptolyngbya sp. 'hensonii']OLP19096.1 hypothetical protein BST81_07760 [Leptolyngbya sp. 'hensonii']